jgi:quercetin dioxygenase-like cupin family protein
MARVFHKADAKQLNLPGRVSRQILSGETGSRCATLRMVEIAPSGPGDSERGSHRHDSVEECIYVLSGTGVTYADSGEFLLGPGDTILIPAGESHVTRNTGAEPLVLLCFFPSADIASSTHEEAPCVREKSGGPRNHS